MAAFVEEDAESITSSKGGHRLIHCSWGIAEDFTYASAPIFIPIGERAISATQLSALKCEGQTRVRCARAGLLGSLRSSGLPAPSLQ